MSFDSDHLSCPRLPTASRRSRLHREVVGGECTLPRLQPLATVTPKAYSDWQKRLSGRCEDVPPCNRVVLLPEKRQVNSGCYSSQKEAGQQPFSTHFATLGGARFKHPLRRDVQLPSGNWDENQEKLRQERLNSCDERL